MLKLKEGQIYTFDKGKKYYIINHFENDDIWFQVWVKDEPHFWSKLFPNEIIFIDVDFMSKYEFKALFDISGKYVGLMNKDYDLNDNWNMVKKKKSTKSWFKMTNIGY